MKEGRIVMEIEGISIDDTVDITDKACPLTFVKQRWLLMSWMMVRLLLYV